MLELRSGVKIVRENANFLTSNRQNIAVKDKETLLNEDLKNAIKTAFSDEDSSSYLGKDLVKIAFEDGTSGQLVSMNLSTLNAARLAKNFDKSDFVLRDDGVLRLTGEAQNFISGWFEKAAYDSNLLAADSDKNGLVDSKESLKSFIYRAPYLQGDSPNPKNITRFTLYGGEKIAYFGCERTIEGNVNSMLGFDKNADNAISFSEFFGGDEWIMNEATSVLNSGGDAKEMINDIINKLKKELMKSFENNDENSKEKAISQGLNALTSAELAEFASQNPFEFKMLQSKEKLENLALNLGLNSSENAEISGENLGLNSALNLASNSGISSENLVLNSSKNSVLNSEISSEKLALNLVLNSENLISNSALNNKISSENLSENLALNLNSSSQNSTLNLNSALNSASQNSANLNDLKNSNDLSDLAHDLSAEFSLKIAQKSVNLLDLRA